MKNTNGNFFNPNPDIILNRDTSPLTAPYGRDAEGKPLTVDQWTENQTVKQEKAAEHAERRSLARDRADPEGAKIRGAKSKENLKLYEKDRNPPDNSVNSLNKLIFDAKSAITNKSSIEDITAKTGKVMNLMSKFNTPNQSNNTSSNMSDMSDNSSIVNNNSNTSIINDYVFNLRREYQTIPSWRNNIG